MQTEQQSLLELLATPNVQFAVPVYQRVYSWDAVQCEELWRDTMRAGKLVSDHFVGTVLYSVETEASSDVGQFDVIDGQQRLATLSIMLSSLVDFLHDSRRALDGVDVEEISRRYLHVLRDGKTASKLLLARADRETFAAVMNDAGMPDEPSARVVENSRLFRQHMDEDGFDARVLWRGMQRLVAIVAELDEEDSPQLVFESLNSKGMPLTTGDLVRNSLLVDVGYKEQARLYHDYWEPIEDALGYDPDGQKLNAAIHGWLAIRFPRAHIHDAGEVYDVFKSCCADANAGSIEDLLDELRGFCLMFGETIRSDPSKKFNAADWAHGKARTRASAFDDLKMPESPLKRDLGSSRRTYS
jgi:hypothetical protein